MGELLLCHSPLAKVPYDVKALSCSIYSVEELCYIMLYHPFLFDEEIVNEALILWLEQEVGEEVLASTLREGLEQELGIEYLAECILKETDYFSDAEKEKVREQIRLVLDKSVFERRKMHADYCVKNQEYFSALQEYYKMLQMEEECRENPILCGNIWHNQGIILARFFLFQEAKECFETAYQFHKNKESLYAAMAASRLLGEQEEEERFVKKYEIDEAEFLTYWNRGSKAAKEQERWITKEKIEETSVKQSFEEWKKEYQKTVNNKELFVGKY